MYTQPLTNDELKHYTPSVFTPTHDEFRTERYEHIGTIDVINQLKSEGFEPFYAAQQGSRNPLLRPYVKHIVRLRHRDNFNINEQHIPELVIINSHNGRSNFEVMSGVFRMICLNGLIMGEKYNHFKYKHMNMTMDEVLEGVNTINNNTTRLMGSIIEMKKVQLTPNQRDEFAQQAAQIRFTDNEEFDHTKLLQPRRYEDDGKDLWSTFNVLQENCMKGGFVVEGTKRKSQTITGVDNQKKFNIELSNIADTYMMAS